MQELRELYAIMPRWAQILLMIGKWIVFILLAPIVLCALFLYYVVKNSK